MKKKKKKKMEKIEVRPIAVYNCSGVRILATLGVSLGRESLAKYLTRLKSSKFVRVKAFPMYGSIGVSAPSLHRESTDSLIEPYFSTDNVILTMSSTFMMLRTVSAASLTAEVDTSRG